ncbi:MAG TPA: hypothetical protein VFZ65_18435 [Planctomycetota bacterium]|nr:hypothetical protein [Planctomycetota bacterium]
MRAIDALLSVALFTAPLACQTIWIVDGDGGGQFTSITAAAQVANDGDIILVRYWSGLAVSWDFVLTKGLTIVGIGSNRAEVIGHLVIQGLTANQRVVLRSLQPDSLPGHAARVTVQQCAGAVVLDDVVLDGVAGAMSGDAGLEVAGSSHVAIGRSHLYGDVGVRVEGATVTCTDSTVLGRSNPGGPGATSPALQATNARLWLSSSLFSGGSNMNMGSWSGPGRNGLLLQGTAATLASCTVYGGYGLLGFAASIDLDAASSLTFDAATWLRDGIGGSGSVANAETGAVMGGIVSAQPADFVIDASPGDFAVLAVSLLEPQVTTPFGPLWLLPPTIDVVAVGMVPVRGTFTAPRGAPHGSAFAMQGIVLHQADVRLSTPLVSTTR